MLLSPPSPPSPPSPEYRSQDFIRSLLTVDVDRRMTVEQAKRHPWLTAAAQSLEAHDLNNNLEEIKLFNSKRKLRSAMSTVRYLVSPSLRSPLFFFFRFFTHADSQPRSSTPYISLDEGRQPHVCHVAISHFFF